MPWFKAILLLISAFVCFSLLPVTLGYLDVSGGQSVEDSSSSSSSTENEFPHSLRHQQHYNHRIEHGVVDFKKETQKLHLQNSVKNNSLSAHQIYLRHHHRSGIISTSTTPPLKSGHHLRHHNRHHESWENRVFPFLGQQNSAEESQDGTTTTRPIKLNMTSTLQSRLFDRDGLYTMPKIRATTGPKSRHNYGSHILPDVPSNRFYADDNRFDDRQQSEMEHSQKYLSGKNNAALHSLSKEDYKEDATDYLYESDEEDKDDDDENDNENEDEDEGDQESPLYSEKWNNIEIKDSRYRREHHPSTKRWISSDDTKSIYSRYNIPGTLTQQKFEELGTHDAVKQSRKAHITNHMQHKAMANAHATKVYSEANCQFPQQRVERIQKDPSKIYVPHCTILHRCGDDTGCCKTDRQTCAPKRTQSIDLYFFVKSFNAKQGSIERHTFINHTECHCVDKIKHHMHSFNPPAQMIRKATVLDCNCPKLFEKILQENGICRCDCSSGNTGCNYLKQGMEHFSMVDRKCIIEGRCKPPTCEFGNYMKKHGRCQRSNEILQQPSLSWSYN